MEIKLRTIYSTPDGKKVEYFQEGRGIVFRLFPLDWSDKKIIALFSSGKFNPNAEAKKNGSAKEDGNDENDDKAAADKEEKARLRAEAKARAEAKKNGSAKEDGNE